MRKLVVAAILAISLAAWAAEPPDSYEDLERWITWAEALEDSTLALHNELQDCRTFWSSTEEELLDCKAELWKAKWDSTLKEDRHLSWWWLPVGVVVGFTAGALVGATK